jgi:hypothetical protein
MKRKLEEDIEPSPPPEFPLLPSLLELQSDVLIHLFTASTLLSLDPERDQSLWVLARATKGLYGAFTHLRVTETLKVRAQLLTNRINTPANPYRYHGRCYLPLFLYALAQGEFDVPSTFARDRFLLLDERGYPQARRVLLKCLVRDRRAILCHLNWARLHMIMVALAQYSLSFTLSERKTLNIYIGKAQLTPNLPDTPLGYAYAQTLAALADYITIPGSTGAPIGFQFWPLFEYWRTWVAYWMDKYPPQDIYGTVLCFALAFASAALLDTEARRGLAEFQILMLWLTDQWRSESNRALCEATVNHTMKDISTHTEVKLLWRLWDTGRRFGEPKQIVYVSVEELGK